VTGSTGLPSFDDGGTIGHGEEPVAELRPASPQGSERVQAAVSSLDPHQVKLVEACRRGFAATGDPAFAAAAQTVTGRA
jgi:hypothetical protein